MYQILYSEEVVNEDLPNIQEPWKNEIKRAVESKLMTRPEVYTRPLRRSLKGYRKLRVGDYRVVLRIEDGTIKIFVNIDQLYIRLPQNAYSLLHQSVRHYA